MFVAKKRRDVRSLSQSLASPIKQHFLSFCASVQLSSLISINLCNRHELSFLDGGSRVVTAQKKTISPLLVPLAFFQLT